MNERDPTKIRVNSAGIPTDAALEDGPSSHLFFWLRHITDTYIKHQDLPKSTNIK